MKKLVMLLLLVFLTDEVDARRKGPRRGQKNRPAESESIDNVVHEKKFRRGRRRGRVGNQRSQYSSEIEIGSPVLRGGGCSSANTAVTLSPDKKSLSLLFDDFATFVGGDSGKKKDVRRCRISLPVKVPRGMQVAIVAIDYRGYNFLPDQANSRLRAGHFFSYRQGGHRRAQKVVRNFDFAGPLDDEFLVTSEVDSGKIWSRCGKDLRMGFITVLRTKTNRQKEEAMSTVDSMDITGRRRSGETLKYHLFWQNCEQGRGANRPQRRHRQGRRGRY